jgi:hypothetical protein
MLLEIDPKKSKTRSKGFVARGVSGMREQLWIFSIHGAPKISLPVHHFSSTCHLEAEWNTRRAKS